MMIVSSRPQPWSDSTIHSDPHHYRCHIKNKVYHSPPLTNIWWAHPDSNWEPTVYETVALTWLSYRPIILLTLASVLFLIVLGDRWTVWSATFAINLGVLAAALPRLFLTEDACLRWVLITCHFLPLKPWKHFVVRNVLNFACALGIHVSVITRN